MTPEALLLRAAIWVVVIAVLLILFSPVGYALVRALQIHKQSQRIERFMQWHRKVARKIRQGRATPREIREWEGYSMKCIRSNGRWDYRDGPWEDS